MAKFTDPRARDRLYLTADVGGTNTSVGLVGMHGGKFSLIDRVSFETQKISGVETAFTGAMDKFGREHGDITVDACAISCAGPVRKNFCELSNADWNIDGSSVSRHLGVKTLLVNDFTALSYSLPLLNPNDPKELLRLPSPDADTGTPHKAGEGLAVRALLGAGTGLGVGYLVEQNGRFTGLPSEGGHADFAPFDEESLALRNFVAERIGTTPGTELFVSGRGILHVWQYYRHIGRIADAAGESGPGRAVGEVEKVADDEKPAVISRLAPEDDGCASVMRRFVMMYAKYASNLALVFLPTDGFYLAGGIAAKNERWFLEDNLFMRHFVTNYKDTVQPLLRAIPVYIIRNYSISLLGAANAFYSRYHFK